MLLQMAGFRYRMGILPDDFSPLINLYAGGTIPKKSVKVFFGFPGLPNQKPHRHIYVPPDPQNDILHDIG